MSYFIVVNIILLYVAFNLRICVICPQSWRHFWNLTFSSELIYVLENDKAFLIYIMSK